MTSFTALIDMALLDVDWGTIDEFVDHVADLPGAQTRMKKAGKSWLKRYLRIRIKEAKDSKGRPLDESVKDKGRGPRRYKQLTLFTVEDFEQVRDYHDKRSRHHKKRAEELVTQCFEQLGIQLELPW